MPTIRYCPFCGKDHKFQIQLDEETVTFELRCSESEILVEKVSEEQQFARFWELRWQFVAPPKDAQFPKIPNVFLRAFGQE